MLPPWQAHATAHDDVRKIVAGQPTKMREMRGNGRMSGEQRARERVSEGDRDRAESGESARGAESGESAERAREQERERGGPQRVCRLYY